MTDLFRFDLHEEDNDPRDGIDFEMANYYDLEDEIVVDVSEVLDEDGDAATEKGASGADTARSEDDGTAPTETADGSGVQSEDGGAAAAETEIGAADTSGDNVRTVKEKSFPKKMGSAAENSRRLAENIKKRAQEADEEEREQAERERGEKDLFGEYENDTVKTRDTELTLAAAAEQKRDIDREKKKQKLRDDEKKAEEKSEIWDIWLQHPAFYVASASLLAAFLLLIISAVATSAGASGTLKAGELTEVHKTVATYDDGSSIYATVGAYRDFIAHDANVRSDYEKSIKENQSPGIPTKAPVQETPFESATPFVMPTEIPAEVTPEPTAEKPTDGNAVVPGREDYYVFNLGTKSYKTERLEAGDFYKSGVGTDSAGELVVSATGKDIDYGFLRIQNPYNSPGFELREVLESPPIVKRAEDGTTPVVLYYTHTSESYCVSEEERKISDFPVIAGYDPERSIAGRGEIFKNACETAGTGVALISDVNDSDYEKAYEKSGAAVEKLAAGNPYIQCAIDLHVNSFEYPAGTRYAPAAVKDGVRYAKVLFVVTQNDETNPGWKDNVKLAMLLIEKLEEKVPGITLGISLRNSAKYNSAATKFGLLVEVGFEGNLVTEADLTAELLGEAVGSLFAGKY